jgi:hypothetical protein
LRQQQQQQQHAWGVWRRRVKGVGTSSARYDSRCDSCSTPPAPTRIKSNPPAGHVIDEDARPPYAPSRRA